VKFYLFHVFPFHQQVLKKICDHPQILTKRAAEHILEGMDGMLNNQEMEMAEKMAMNLGDMPRDDEAVEVGPEVSCKLFFILALLVSILWCPLVVTVFRICLCKLKWLMSNVAAESS
jgi:hypothetical protein